MSKVKHPDEFLDSVRLPVLNALTAEVRIPFQSTRLLKLFRASIYDFVRANRTHKTPLSAKLRNLTAKMYTTHDVSISRPEWQPGPQYPLTLIIDARPKFEDNVANMQLSGDAVLDPPTRTDVTPLTHTTPPLEDDSFEYRDDDGDRAKVFSDILGRLDS
jgi:hypothetical protein